MRDMIGRTTITREEHTAPVEAAATETGAKAKKSAKNSPRKRTSSKTKSSSPTASQGADAKRRSAKKPGKTATPSYAKTRDGSSITRRPSRPASTKKGNDPAANRDLTANRFSVKELEEFREALLAKRRELLGDFTDHEEQSIGEPDAGNPAAEPGDLAAWGTDTWEREFNMGLMQNQQSLLREVEEALARIESGDYGYCQATGASITKSRLRAVPWAKYCIEYARRFEARSA